MILSVGTDEYYKYCKKTRRNTKTVMFNGCFDLIHAGHIQFFNYIQNQYKNSYASVICAINSDFSVKLLNKSHPLINPLEDRIKIINILFNQVPLDFIVFDTKTPCAILWHIMPDLIYKGIDYEGTEFPEKFIMDKIGGEIKYYNSGIEMSTTKIIERVLKACKN